MTTTTRRIRAAIVALLATAPTVELDELRELLAAWSSDARQSDPGSYLALRDVVRCLERAHAVANRWIEEQDTC